MRSEVKRNGHMADIVTAINLVNNIHFSIAPLTVQYTCATSSMSKNLDVPSLKGSQVLEVEPICRIALRLHRLQRLEKYGDKLSLYTNNAYYAVVKACKEATAVSHLRLSHWAR